MKKQEKEDLFALYLIEAMNARLDRVNEIDIELSLESTKEDREKTMELERSRFYHMKRLQLE